MKIHENATVPHWHLPSMQEFGLNDFAIRSKQASGSIVREMDGWMERLHFNQVEADVEQICKE